MKRTIGNSKLSYDELQTAVTEVELVLNSRPLSYVLTEDLEEPLTPSHLITGLRLLSLRGVMSKQPEDPDYQVAPSSPTDLSRRMQHFNRILNHFWMRWRREYLTKLREAHRRGQSRSDGSNITVGDIVLVNDPDHPRTFWKLARLRSLLRAQMVKSEEHVFKLERQAPFSVDQYKHYTLWRFVLHNQLSPW